MRTFVTFDKHGNILATCRSAFMPEGIKQPYFEFNESQGVIEVEPASELENLSCVEIHENYRIDITKKKLTRKKNKIEQ